MPLNRASPQTLFLSSEEENRFSHIQEFFFQICLSSNNNFVLSNAIISLTKVEIIGLCSGFRALSVFPKKFYLETSEGKTKDPYCGVSRGKSGSRITAISMHDSFKSVGASTTNAQCTH